MKALIVSKKTEWHSVSSEISDEPRIIIAPAQPRYVLAELLKGITPEAMREAFDWGPDKGREIVE